MLKGLLHRSRPFITVTMSTIPKSYHSKSTIVNRARVKVPNKYSVF